MLSSKKGPIDIATSEYLCKLISGHRQIYKRNKKSETESGFSVSAIDPLLGWRSCWCSALVWKVVEC